MDDHNIHTEFGDAEFSERCKKSEFDAEKERVLDTIKVEVNSFLFSRMSPKTTLAEADKLALHITKEIMDSWNLS